MTYVIVVRSDPIRSFSPSAAVGNRKDGRVLHGHPPDAGHDLLGHAGAGPVAHPRAGGADSEGAFAVSGRFPSIPVGSVDSVNSIDSIRSININPECLLDTPPPVTFRLFFFKRAFVEVFVSLD